MTQAQKERAARAALDFVTDGMVVGLGTGSTAKIFIDLLIGRVRETGWSIRGIPTSEASRAQAIAGGISLIDPDETTPIDVAIDGADEIDPSGNMIKGGGAALLREKIIATSAHQMVVIADESKAVAQLGAFPLPIEIEQFGWALTIRAIRQQLAKLGHEHVELTLRPGDGAEFVLSDGGNYVLDVKLGRINDPIAIDRALTMVPGVVTTGLFVSLSPTIIIGTDTGTTDGRP